jgi:PRC-barrel domain
VSETPAGTLPDLAETRSWTGCELDDAAGRSVGRVTGIYVDTEVGRPVWLVVAMSRRRRAKAVVVPLRECAAMPGRVWTAQDRQAMREAPAVDPARPLLREHETAICSHYGIGEGAGRHAEVATRPAGSVTAQPS